VNPTAAPAGPRAPAARARRWALTDWFALAAGALVTLATVYGLMLHPRLTRRGLLALAVLAVAALVVEQRRRLARLSLSRIVLWLAIALPLAALVGPSASLPGLRQLFAFRVLVGLLVVLALTWALATRGSLRRHAASFLALLLVWFAWLTLSLAWAPDKGAGLRYLLILAAMLVLVVAVAATGSSRRRLQGLCAVLAFAYLLTVAITLLEMVLGLHLASSSLVNAPQTKQWGVTSFFYNPNNLATFLALCWPFLFTAFFVTRRRPWWWLAAAGMGLGLLALVHTGSRSSLLTIGLETVIAVLYFTRIDRARAKWFGAVVGVALVAGFAWLAFNNSTSDMIRQFRLPGLVQSVQQGHGSGSTRLGLLRSGLDVGMSYGFVGVGPGNAENLVKNGPVPVGIGNLHDWWLEVLVDGGLPSLVVYVLFYFGLMGVLLKVARRATDPLYRYLAVATFVAFAGYIVGCLGPSSAISFTPMWILFGVGLATVVRAGRATQERAL